MTMMNFPRASKAAARACEFCGGRHTLLNCPKRHVGPPLPRRYHPPIPMSERRVEELSPYALRAEGQRKQRKEKTR